MPRKTKRKRKNICIHEYIRNEGIITCTKCNLKSILYLNTIKSSLNPFTKNTSI